MVAVTKIAMAINKICAKLQQQVGMGITNGRQPGKLGQKAGQMEAVTDRHCVLLVL